MKIMTNEHLFKIGVLPSEIFIGNNGMTSWFPDIKWEVILPVGVRTNTALYPTDVYLPNWQVRLMLNKKKKRELVLCTRTSSTSISQIIYLKFMFWRSENVRENEWGYALFKEIFLSFPRNNLIKT